MKRPYFYILLSFLFLLSNIFIACEQTSSAIAVIPPSKSVLQLKKIKSLKDSISAKELLPFIDTGIDITNKNDSLYLVFLDYKIFYLNKLKNYDQSLSIADSLLYHAIRLKDTMYIARGNYRKSIINKYKNNLKLAFKYASESKKWSLLINDSLNIGKRLKEMAIIQEKLGDFVGCQADATEALRYLTPLNRSNYIYAAHNAIAISYRKQKLYSNALQEYRNALKHVSAKIDSLRVLNNITVVHRFNGDHTKVIAILEPILNEKILQKEPPLLAKVIDNLAYSRWLSNKEINILPELEKALEIRISENDLEGLQASYAHLANFFSNKDKPKQIQYLKKHLETSKVINNTEDQLQVLSKLVTLLPSYKSIRYAKRYVKISDSIKSVRIRDFEYFSKIKYDNSLVQEENFKLRIKNTQNRLRLIEERHKNLRILAGGLLFLIAGVGSIWFLIIRSSREKIKEIYLTENRISKKVHDEIANGIYQVMTVIQQREENTALVDKLDDVYTKARNISRETNVINTGAEYPEELMALLEFYAAREVKLTVIGLNDINWKTIHKIKKQVVYRVVQELMTNMKKHSKATQVFVRFSIHNKNVQILYSDNGIGLPKNRMISSNGLQIVETRTQSIKGTLNFETNQGKGLKVYMNFPI